MKLLIALTLACSLLLCQTGTQVSKPTTTTSSAKSAPSVSDKDRADFLLSQRNWMQVQKQYEAAFTKEPAVAEFEGKVKHLQQFCQASGSNFDPQTVQCVAVKEEPAQTPRK